MLKAMQQGQMEAFQEAVWEYYHAHGRHDLPWRVVRSDGSIDPYTVLVSEIMLQQTQVTRVIPKYQEFLARFPDVQSLAAAPLSEVLRVWSGLGYNRRAKFLWEAAHQIRDIYAGTIPRTSSELIGLSGVGPNTAGAILTYAYNIAVPFIETNIRTVFIHHFFSGQEDVGDKAILGLVAASVPDDPRSWYWALMDYGTYVKQTVGNLNKLSKHYVVQSPFIGSKRQIRGEVLRHLADGEQSLAALSQAITDPRLSQVLSELMAEGMIDGSSQDYKLPGA